MTMIGSPACPLGRLEGQARGGGEGEGRCRLSSPPPKGATPCDRPPRGAILIPRPLGVVDYSRLGDRAGPSTACCRRTPVRYSTSGSIPRSRTPPRPSGRSPPTPRPATGPAGPAPAPPPPDPPHIRCTTTRPAPLESAGDAPAWGAGSPPRGPGSPEHPRSSPAEWGVASPSWAAVLSHLRTDNASLYSSRL